jgi:hypothetical protein
MLIVEIERSEFQAPKEEPKPDPVPEKVKRVFSEGDFIRVSENLHCLCQTEDCRLTKGNVYPIRNVGRDFDGTVVNYTVGPNEHCCYPIITDELAEKHFEIF